MKMEQKFNIPGTGSNEKKDEKLFFPHGEYGINEYEKMYGNNPEEIEKVKEIFDTFLKQEIMNVKIYKSSRFGVSFPYTHIDMNSFARNLYKKQTGKEAKINPVKIEEEKHLRREYIFPGAPLKSDLTDNGPFHFIGESMHQCIGKLPSALEKIINNEEPDDFEIFMLGTPVNEFGTMSPEFLENFKKDPTGVMSEVFAEFIGKDYPSDNNKKDKIDIELYGISWGGGVSLKTSEKLLETGSFTQDLDEVKNKKTPQIIIRAQNPVSLSRVKPLFKGPQIWLGSPLNDTVSGDPYGPTMGKNSPEFSKQITIELEKRGIHPQMSEEQQKLKKKAIIDIVLSFRKSVEPKPETKINEIYGLQDLTTKSSSLTKEVREQKENHGESLGLNLAKPQRENSRVFGVNTFHEIPWFRENELKRIKVAVKKLEELNK